MSVVMSEGSKTVDAKVQKSVRAAESANWRAGVAGLISDVEARQEARTKALDEFKQKWLQSEELRRRDLEAKRRRRERAVYD